MDSARALLMPRDLPGAARAGAAFALVGAALLAGMTLAVPHFTPTAFSRWSALGLSALLVVQGLLLVRCPERLPPGFWVFVPTQVIAVTTLLDLTTADASATGQAFLIWPVLFAAYELRPWAAVASLLQSLVAETVIVFALLPTDRAVTDLVCVGTTLTVLCFVLVSARENQARLIGQLERRAAVDPLTGLASRRVLDEAMGSALRDPGAGRTALLLVDVDRFKSINDGLGHPAGDAVLVHVAALLSAVFPPPALVARLGGDELAVLLPGTPVAQAAEQAERFRRRLGEDPPRAAGRVTPVTVSIGAAATRGAAPRELYARADEALYDAKRSGRDQVRALGEPGAPGAPGPRQPVQHDAGRDA